MRIDPNYMIFCEHEDWYTFEAGKGYIPTEKAPVEAIEAMKRYNNYTFNKK